MICVDYVDAEGIRDRTRPDFEREEAVSEAQADTITLTLVQTDIQALQTWVRTSGAVDSAGKVLSTTTCQPNADLVRIGQRVRSFPPDSKSSIYQAKITRVEQSASAAEGCYDIQATVLSKIQDINAHYVMEIVVPRGEFLAIPKEAIIEEGGKRIVYVSHQPGHYMRHEIETGVEGEIYTEVVKGLVKGLNVVTIGSFFVDAEHKLKGSEQEMSGHAHHHH